MVVHWGIWYGSPNDGIREILWSELATIAMSHSEPWLIAGDFNDFLSSDEKSGGVEISQNK